MMLLQENSDEIKRETFKEVMGEYLAKINKAEGI
jgi:hypothetical protein